MQSGRFKIIKEILAYALALPGAEREAYVREAAAGDEALIDEILALMQFDDERAAADIASEITDGEAEIGREIDGFRLLRVLGEGGMGVVYLAEQIEPIRRRVALKIIKIGMDTREVISRFEAERQALALMDHPNIARVIEAGATPNGRPYFVMEYIDGTPITEFCRDRGLSLDQRLRLFVQVCRAVHHAHQRGIIHRDLKPGNVLVADGGDEGGPTAKVIDFGVAKATEQRLTENTVCTRLGVMVGTPEYMSPEQAVLEQADVDNRCDVYSLGVILYELLTGELPITRKTLVEAGWAKIREMLQEHEPPQPSTRIDRAATGEAAAGEPVPLPCTWTRRLRGDLDWVTMRALEKDRERRYESSALLADEIERFLGNQPVDAGPPGRWYRARKFVRRHRVPVTVALVVLAALLAGITGTTIGMVRAGRAEQQARAAARASEAGRLFELARNTELPSRSLAILNAALHLDDRREYRLQIEYNLLQEPPLHRLPLAVDSHNPHAVDISPDGQWLSVAWSKRGSLQLFPLAGGDPIPLVGHRHAVISARFLPDGSALISAGQDSTVRAWSLPRGELIRTWKFEGLVLPFLHRDGFPLTFLEARDGLPFRKYKCASLEEEPALGGEVGPALGLARETMLPAVGPDGRWMVTMRDSLVAAYDLDDPGDAPARVLGVHAGNISNADISPDGTEAVTSDMNGLARVWSLAGGTTGPVREFQSDIYPYRTVFSDDGRWISASSAHGHYLWDRELPSDAKPLVLMGSEYWSFDTAFHPTLPWVVSLHTGAMAAAWSLDGPRRIDLVVDESDVGAVGFSPDGRWLVGASDGGTIKAWPLDGERIDEGRVLGRYPNHRFGFIAFDDSSRYCYLSVCNSPEGAGDLTRVRLADGETRIWYGGSCEWYPDAAGRLAAFPVDQGMGVNRVRILDLETDEWIDLAEQEGQAFYVYGFVRDGRLLTGGDDGLGLWSRDGREFERIADTPPIVMLAGDRETVLVRDQDGGWLRGRYDAPSSWQPVREPRNRDHYFHAIDMHGDRLAMGALSGDVEVLDFETGESYPVPLGDDTIRYPAFDPQGRWIALSGVGVVTLLPVPSGSCRLDWETDRYLEWLDSLSNLRIEVDPNTNQGYRTVGRSVPDWQNPPSW